MAAARFQIVSLPRPAIDSRSALKPPPQRFTWRFLAANNRSLATSTVIFPDAYSCVAALHELRRRLTMTGREFFRDDDGLWSWRIRLDSDVAASSHRYQRQVRARITCDTFLALAAQPAALDNVAVVYR